MYNECMIFNIVYIYVFCIFIIMCCMVWNIVFGFFVILFLFVLFNLYYIVFFGVFFLSRFFVYGLVKVFDDYEKLVKILLGCIMLFCFFLVNVLIFYFI